MPERCVIVVDEALPAGLAANAAAVLGVTLGAREPAVVGDDLVDGDDRVHAGLFRAGLPILKAARADLEYLAPAVYGARRPVGRLTGNLSLLR
jgi:hypothetical protein